MRSALWVDRFQSSGCHKYPLTPQLNGPVRGTTREGALGHGNGLPPCCRPSCAHGSGDDDGALRSPDDGRGPGYLDQPYLPSIGQGIYGGINLSWGLRAKLTERMSARLEFLGFNETDRISDFGIVRAGLNYKFGP